MFAARATRARRGPAPRARAHPSRGSVRGVPAGPRAGPRGPRRARRAPGCSTTAAGPRTLMRRWPSPANPFLACTLCFRVDAVRWGNHKGS
ncbi:hypothetical protein CYQ11_13450 [Streptomyces cinnamoneus]|nr:hypothetical protein CYQ11_13450 [Streptomyces cinnamoneus]